MIEVIPAIIAYSREELEQKIKLIEPYVDRVHLDIMDGVFVQNKTIDGIGELKNINTHLDFDVHLMVQRPQEIIDAWLNTKADRFLIHIESEGDITSLASRIHSANKQIGMVLSPETDISRLEAILSSVDAVQFMTVHPGDYGGAFVESVLEKIKSFHNQYPDVKIIVDGAMHLETAKLAVAAGASTIVMGGHIFNEDRKISEALEEFKSNL